MTNRPPAGPTVLILTEDTSDGAHDVLTADAMPGVYQYKKYYFVEVAKMFTEETYPPEVTPDITFTGDYELPLSGGAVVALHELASSGVSSTQTVASIPAKNALIVGDLVHHEAHAWLEGGIVEGKPSPDLGAWQRALDELTAYEGATVYGGRGEPGAVAAVVGEEKAYLEAMDQLVRDYVAGLGDKKDELTGPLAGEHYKAIADLAAARFPGYAYPYLVEYGVYGLVNAILAEQP